jgi:hypothetical protein
MNNAIPFSIAGLLCPFIVLALIVAVVILIIRAAVQSGSGTSAVRRPSRLNVLTEMADDGFWIVSCGANPNAMLHYHYWAGGVRRVGQVPFQPDPSGRQFVYTGVRPEQAAIVNILEDPDDVSASMLPPVIGAGSAFLGAAGDDTQDTPSPPPSPPSFPSAY